MGFNGPEVSEVCFGSLAISPLQGRVNFEEGAEILRYAIEQGITWVDTAEIYDNYEQLASVLKSYPDVRVVTKSYAVTSEEMALSIEKARKGFNRDVIDFFLLHEQESALTLKGHKGAWEELLSAKERGIVRWIGISTHAAAGVRAGALQQGLDLIHPIVNMQGLGIIDGTIEDMLKSISFASELGIGIYAMKVFGGGHLSSKAEVAIDFIKGIKDIHAMALGMSTREEVDFNLAILSGKEVSDELKNLIKAREKKLYIADWCEGCGRCLDYCPQRALYLEETVKVDHNSCVLCGYCGRACPHFCLKIV